MPLKIIAAPTVEPVTGIEAKGHARIDTAADDIVIDRFIREAREEAEGETKRAIMTQTWELALALFPAEIVVPLPPLQSVTSIKYIDTDGAEQTLAATEYEIDAFSEPARIRPAYGKSWPSTRDVYNAVKIRFVAGYAGAADVTPPVPEGIKAWILIRFASKYENREATVLGQTVAEIPRNFIDGLLDPYRVMSF